MMKTPFIQVNEYTVRSSLGFGASDCLLNSYELYYLFMDRYYNY